MDQQAGNAEGDDDWRGKVSQEIRQQIIDDIVDAVKQVVEPSRPEGNQMNIKEIAQRFEDKNYHIAKDLNDYLHRIATKVNTIKESSQSGQSSLQSNSSSSAAIQLGTGNMQNNGSLTALQGTVNSPSMKPPDSSLAPGMIPHMVGHKINLQSISGDRHKLAERAPYGYSSNYQKHGNGGQFSAQVFSQQNQEHSLSFQQDPIQAQSMWNSQSAVRQQQWQRTQHPSFVTQNPPMKEQLLSSVVMPSRQNSQTSVANNIGRSQNHILGKQTGLPDMQHRHQQQKLPYQHKDSQSMQSWSLTPKQQQMSQPQIPNLQILRFPQHNGHQRLQTSDAMMQWEIQDKAGILKNGYLMELKEVCLKTIKLICENGVDNSEKSKLMGVSRYLNDRKSITSVEQLEKLKQQLDCRLQVAISRKPAYSQRGEQLSSNVHQLLQSQSQTFQAQRPEEQRKQQLQSMSPIISAVSLPQHNVKSLQENSLLCLSGMGTSQQQTVISQQQHLTKSNVEQVSMGTSKAPLSTLQHPSVTNTLSKSCGNKPEPNMSSIQSTFVVPQHMHPKEMKKQHQVREQLLHWQQEVQQQQQFCEPLKPELTGSGMNVRLGKETPSSQMSQISGQHSLFDGKHLKSGGSLSVSSAKLLQSASSQGPQNSPQSSSFIIPSSTTFVPSSEPGFSETSSFFIPSSTTLVSSPEPGFSETSSFITPSSTLVPSSEPGFSETGSLIISSSTTSVPSFQLGFSETSSFMIPSSPIFVPSSQPGFSETSSLMIPSSTTFVPSSKPGFSKTSSFIVPSSATFVPSSQPGFSENAVFHKADALEPMTQSKSKNTAIPNSPLVECEKSVEPNYNVPTNTFVEFSDHEQQPIHRLTKVVSSMSSRALRAVVSEIGAVVTLADRLAESNAIYGSEGSPEDLAAMCKIHSQERYLMDCDDDLEMSKMKRSTNVIASNIIPSASLEKLGLEYTTITHKQKDIVEVNHFLVEEIWETNCRLLDTVVDISDEENTNSTAAGTGGGKGTIVKCSFSGMTVSPKSDLPKSLFHPLRLLVPSNYPDCSPTVLEELPWEGSKDEEDLTVKAKVILNRHLRTLSQPMSLAQIAKAWNASCRAVIIEFAENCSGGGTFSSKYGKWEDVNAA